MTNENCPKSSNAAAGATLTNPPRKRINTIKNSGLVELSSKID
jgi:hypothetical protein